MKHKMTTNITDALNRYIVIHLLNLLCTCVENNTNNRAKSRTIIW